MAAQDQAISTNNFKKKILKQDNENRWLCKEYEKTNDHLTSGYSTLAMNANIIWHDKVCTHVHYSICKISGTATTENWYSHTPKSVTECVMESAGRDRYRGSGKQAWHNS
jgi:hypothetical protein